MNKLLLALTKRLWPELEARQQVEQAAGMANVASFLYGTPLALLGLIWLIAETDLALVRREWPMLLLLLLLALLLKRLRFFLFLDIKGVPTSASGALDGVVTWTGALLFGPTALWIATLWVLVGFARQWRQPTLTDKRWYLLRNLVLDVTSLTLASLAALTLYQRWGGVFPLPELTRPTILPALYATLVQSLLTLFIYLPFVAYVGLRAFKLTASPALLGPFFQVTTVGLISPVVATPFAIWAAGLYTQIGLSAFLFFVAGLLLVSLMAHQLSQAVKRSQQRSRELDQLEQLGRAIITAPLDASTLPQLLREHVPGMFPASQIEIRLFPEQTILNHPEDRPALPAPVWEWVRTTAQARHFLPQVARPWDTHADPAADALVVVPVLDAETAQPIGGICVAPLEEFSEAARLEVSRLLPAVQALAAQISSTLHSADVYAQTLAHQKVEQELSLAGEIQASFLPNVLPDVPGWQLAVTLEPARQTSGDFYDVIPLPNGRLGILVADVADKGTGAALYMALSRTLIRTYAVEHHTRPDYALRVANSRILTDTHIDLFVTVFYGIIDPITGTLTYCNAGHNPPYLLSTQKDGAVQKLTRTGLPLGIFRGETWQPRTAQLAPGDTLLLYTDGVTEAQDGQAAFFGESRLLAALQAHWGRPAQEVQAALLREIHTFVGDAPQFDDITMMVVVRET